MTRINCGIPPASLSDRHLLAEHREIKRIPNCIKKGRYSLEGIPERFKLGEGHVKFFYNKLGYLQQRYTQIYNEAKRRGFNVTNYLGAFNGCPDELYGDYEPTTTDIEIVKQRIIERS